ncbi:PAP2 superfamily [Legionella busanensis]|uniref:PAP2 superfamily n=1 Tax=Legionella busanensis TaxID=190655 RepID=A0A378JPE9_9GAMM|nr:vanadium-dependent haloperoxidase [Legionella busanensis]STX52069.1 PAP2 superfamily [Legionella busanensis]
MKKGWLALSLSVSLIIILTGLYFYLSNTKTQQLPTYFTYTPEEQASLFQLQSNKLMTTSSLKKWDNLMFDLVKSHKLADAPASKLYAYVTTAQRDAAFLAFNSKHQFIGSLDIVSSEVLCLFFPDSCLNIKLTVNNDDRFSRRLSDLVLGKIKQRIAKDRLNERLSPQLAGEGYWAGVKPFFGQEVGSWAPWFISSVKQYLSPNPPKPNDPAWQAQLKQTEKALSSITPEQTKAVVFWAGNPSTVTPPGIWLKFANDYMDREQIPFSKVVFVRSVLSMGIADAVIALFNAKYTYWIKRPFMLNPNIHTVMPTPNHPSYPAGHSCISAAAATILTYYFPKNKSLWWEEAHQASSSRVWGGIHFPIDGSEGLKLGEKVAHAVLQAQSQTIVVNE